MRTVLLAIAVDSPGFTPLSRVCVWLPCSWVRALLRQEGGPGARAVPAYGRQEVAVLQGGRPGLQVLRAPHAPRPQPFKKACGSAARAPAARPAAAAAAGPRAHRWLPEPPHVPIHPRRQRRRRRRGRWWCWWRWHVRPGAHLSAAHGQCRCLRDCCWWREQRSQVLCLRGEVSVGRAQPALVRRRRHGRVNGQLVAPVAVPNRRHVPGHKLPSVRRAERSGREHHRLAAQDAEGAPLLLRERLRDPEAGEPDAAPLLRRVAQVEGLVAGAERGQQPRLLGHPALHLHPHGALRLQHQLQIAEWNTVKMNLSNHADPNISELTTLCCWPGLIVP
ncbi:Putative growth-regulating factor 6 [Zea mays]|uniref:Putative growth-regulating factor 6 n=1 Tax=Zea mays TaxID=4577 RepID=A0A1D6E0P1_MAIZE|nr:Putative growth-regulating factor 6 [Zea mays]